MMTTQDLDDLAGKVERGDAVVLSKDVMRELLARAKAWERILQSHADRGGECAVRDEIAEWDAMAENGFPP